MIQLSAPAQNIHTAIKIQGSKSISNRLLVLNELLKANRELHNLSDSEDTHLLAKALEQIRNSTAATIDIHHAGTDMRFLTALLAVTPGTWLLTGSARMKQRPVGELVNSLRNLGAEIEFTGTENFPPLKISGKKIAGGRVEINAGISSQFVSALLLAAPAFENGLELVLKNNVVSRPYIDMTIALLKTFGVQVNEKDNKIIIAPSSILCQAELVEAHFTPDSYRDSIYIIESDWSSASYWYEICALSHNAVIELSNFNENSLQADAVLPKLYDQLGVQTNFKDNSIRLSRKKRTTTAFNYDFTQCPDLAQTLAVTCAGLGIAARLTGIQTLKIKETDRIVALKNELEKTGIKVEITGDSMQIHGRSPDQPLLPVTVATYHDHRMAMSFAPLALLYDAIKIDDPDVVSKSYPLFWKDLECAGFNVNLQP